MTQPRTIVSFILFAPTVLILSTPSGAQSIKAPRTPGMPPPKEQQSRLRWGQAVVSPAADAHNAQFTFVSIDVPNATFTLATGIGPSGDIVDDAAGNEHGFLQRWGESTPITIDVPGNPPFNSILTDAFGINSAGRVVAQYIDSSGNFHGFLAVPAGQ